MAAPARRRVFEPSSKRSKRAPGPWPHDNGLNPKTLAKGRGRSTTADAAMGPGNPGSTVLTPLEEVMILDPAPHAAALGRCPRPELGTLDRRKIAALVGLAP
jgi:hypothetical protein